MQKKILIIFVVWTFWISLEFLLGPYSHIRIFDSGDWIIPQLIATKSQIFKFGPSYFGNFLPGGVDLASNLLAPFSSLNSILFYILPSSAAYGLLLFAQRFLAGYFTYRLCKDSLELSTKTSLLAGMAYSLFNFSENNFTVYHQLSEPGFPFFLWVLDKLIKTNKIKQIQTYLIAFALGLFWGFSTYLPFGIPFLIPTAAIYFIFILKRFNKKLILVLTFCTLGAIIIQIPQIIALIQNSPGSIRSLTGIRTQSQAFIVYLQTVLNFFFVYKFQFFIFLFVWVFVKRNLLTKKIKGILMLSLVFSICAPFTSLIQPYLHDYLGFAAGFQFNRFDMVAPFMVTILAAVSLETLFLSKKVTRNIKLSFIIIVFSVILLESFKIKILTIKNYASFKSLYQRPDLQSLYNMDKSIYRIATIYGLGLNPAYNNAYGFESVDGYLSIYPLSYHGFWFNIIKNRIFTDSRLYNYFTKWGGRIYLYSPTGLNSNSNIDFQKNYDLNLLSMANVKYIISPAPIISDQLTLLPSTYRETLNNWQNWSFEKKLVFFLKGEYFGQPLYIYENKGVLPRFYLIKNDQVIANAVQVKKYSPDEIELRVGATTDSKLVISINYYPFWHAEVDNQKVQLDKYLDSFMELDIRKGGHDINLKYNPSYRLF
jgi:hypothetical protein